MRGRTLFAFSLAALFRVSTGICVRDGKLGNAFGHLTAGALLKRQLLAVKHFEKYGRKY